MDEFTKIKAVFIISQAGVNAHIVGEKGVDKIENVSNIDRGIARFFVYGKDNELIAELINLPVDIKYYSAQELKDLALREEKKDNA